MAPVLDTSQGQTCSPTHPGPCSFNTHETTGFQFFNKMVCAESIKAVIAKISDAIQGLAPACVAELSQGRSLKRVLAETGLMWTTGHALLYWTCLGTAIQVKPGTPTWPYHEMGLPQLHYPLSPPCGPQCRLTGRRTNLPQLTQRQPWSSTGSGTGQQPGPAPQLQQDLLPHGVTPLPIPGYTDEHVNP